MDNQLKDLTPEKLISEADKKNKDSSILLSQKLRSLSKGQRLRYLEELMILFKETDETDRLFAGMNPDRFGEYSVMVGEFEDKHGRKPNKREKDKIFDQQEETFRLRLRSDKYRKLKSKAEKWLNELQDDFISNAQDDKITMWINEHIPSSPNKGEYKKAFQVVCKYPKDAGIPFLLDEIHEDFEPSISDQSLRKQIRVFKNTFQF